MENEVSLERRKSNFLKKNAILMSQTGDENTSNPEQIESVSAHSISGTSNTNISASKNEKDRVDRFHTKLKQPMDQEYKPEAYSSEFSQPDLRIPSTDQIVTSSPMKGGPAEDSHISTSEIDNSRQAASQVHEDDRGQSPKKLLRKSDQNFNSEFYSREAVKTDLKALSTKPSSMASTQQQGAVLDEHSSVLDSTLDQEFHAGRKNKQNLTVKGEPKLDEAMQEHCEEEKLQNRTEHEKSDFNSQHATISRKTAWKDADESTKMSKNSEEELNTRKIVNEPDDQEETTQLPMRSNDKGEQDIASNDVATNQGQQSGTKESINDTSTPMTSIGSTIGKEFQAWVTSDARQNVIVRAPGTGSIDYATKSSSKKSTGRGYHTDSLGDIDIYERETSPFKDDVRIKETNVSNSMIESESSQVRPETPGEQEREVNIHMSQNREHGDLTKVLLSSSTLSVGNDYEPYFTNVKAFYDVKLFEKIKRFKNDR